MVGKSNESQKEICENYSFLAVLLNRKSLLMVDRLRGEVREGGEQ